MELFGERGFEQTTVAQIAARAGLTERTFFRHYADKREVLFGGVDRNARKGKQPSDHAPVVVEVSYPATPGLDGARRGVVFPLRVVEHSQRAG